MTRIVTLITLLVLPVVSALAGPTPIIDTVAGGGGPTTCRLQTANLNQPRPAIAPGGDLYIAVAGGHRVYRIDPTGLLIAVAGRCGPPQGAMAGLPPARPLRPGGSAFDAAGNLFISTGLTYAASDAVQASSRHPGNAPGAPGGWGPALQASFQDPTTWRSTRTAIYTFSTRARCGFDA